MLEGNEFFIYRDTLERIQTKLGLHKILEIVWYWLYTNQTIRQMSFNAGIAHTTVVEWLNHCRTIVAKAMDNEPLFLGTEAMPIQIDEAKISGGAKYNKGRRLSGDARQSEDENEILDWNPDDDDDGDENVEPENFVRFGEDNREWKWVVGIYHGPGRVQYVRVPNRTSRTLLAVISKYCAPGSVIHTDGWKAYESIKNHGYTHRAVIHEENYVDPHTGVHTQGVERSWVEVKAWFRAAPGILCCYNLILMP